MEAPQRWRWQIECDMYGMVNKAAEDYVCSYFGEEKWGEIRAKAGVDVAAFLDNETYPDATTQRLIGAAAELLEVPAENILEGLGEHWMLKTAKSGYGPILDATGRTLLEFLANFPAFFSHSALIFPKSQPPRFTISDATPTSVRLHYHAPRPGLQPFVLGLLRGLGKKFKTHVKVEIAAAPAQGVDTNIFAVRWTPVI